jgi:putative heme degradation protein
LQEVTNQEQEKIKQLIQTFDSGGEFIEKVHNGFSEKIAYGKDLQVMYEQSYSNSKLIFFIRVFLLSGISISFY